jgi:hypothetical protein
MRPRSPLCPNRLNGAAQRGRKAVLPSPSELLEAGLDVTRRAGARKRRPLLCRAVGMARAPSDRTSGPQRPTPIATANQARTRLPLISPCLNDVVEDRIVPCREPIEL